MEVNIKGMVKTILAETDLFQEFADIAENNLAKLSRKQRVELMAELKAAKPGSPDEAGGIAMIVWMLENQDS